MKKKPNPKISAQFFGGPMDGQIDKVDQMADVVGFAEVGSHRYARYRRDWSAGLALV